MKYLPLVWMGIWRKRSRAVLMLLQIVSAFTLFGLLQGLNSGIKQAIAKTHADRLYVASSVSMGEPLPMSMVARLESVPGVLHVSERVQMGGYYQKPTQFVPLIGVNVGTFFRIYDEIVVAPEHVETLGRTRTGTIAGKRVLEEYGLDVGDRITLESPIARVDGSREWAFDIVGMFDTPEQPNGANALIVNSVYVNEARATGRDHATLFVAQVEDADAAASVALAIDNAFANSQNETRTQSEGDLIATQIQRIADLDFIIRGIIGAVFFAMLFSTAALMMQSIRERLPELAVLKTVGYTDRMIMVLILAESIALCVFAAGIGLVVASLLLGLVREQIGVGGMPGIVIAAGVGFALLLALIGGSVPAWRGLKLQVADALADR